MKRSILGWYCLMIMFFSCCCGELDAAEIVTWSSEREVIGKQGKQVSATVTVIGEEATWLEDERQVILIDYATLLLQRFDKASRQIRQFSLTRPGGVIPTERQAIAEQRMAELLAKYRVVVTDQHEFIAGHQCRVKKVLFRVRLAAAMIAPPVVEQYGQHFTEGVEEHWVTEDIDGLDFLRQAAARREVIFSANPLLRRLDPLGLLPGLGGFSVKVCRKELPDRQVIDTLVTISRKPRGFHQFRLPSSQ